MTSIPTYSAQIDSAANALFEADYILIGAGAGLSAAAGLNYRSTELFDAWYPQFAKMGYSTIWDAITHYWYPEDTNRRQFWAFWATHIQRIRYEAPAGQPYLELYQLVKRKPHFIITTNVDGQFGKAGFASDQMFTPQGDYGKFQCAKPCRPVLYNNAEMVQHMLESLDEERLHIPERLIPHCPNCGGYLERNIRIDRNFVEEPHMEKYVKYSNFINHSTSGKLVLLELGVGFNTPSIIRWPFEQITSQHPQATLIRVNLEDAGVPGKISARSIGFNADIGWALRNLHRAIER